MGIIRRSPSATIGHPRAILDKLRMAVDRGDRTPERGVPAMERTGADKSVFGPYRVIQKLAGGGMAEIFLVAHQDLPDKYFCLKKIRSDRDEDDSFHTMLLDEARISARLTHPNIARVLGKVEHNGHLGLLLEYVDGIDLIRMQRAFSERQSQLGLDVAIHLIIEVLEGLEFAHRVRDEDGSPLNIVHRDVSPGNVMIDVEGRVRIIDWGIARAERRMSQTEAGNVKGKFRYMAPEQIAGHVVGPFTDVYAAAMVLWEILANKRIYDKLELGEMMMRVSQAKCPSLDEARPGLPSMLHDVYRKATTRAPENRFQTAKDFAEALRRLPTELDPAGCRVRLKKATYTARLLESRRGYERAVEQARRIYQETEDSNLEGALMRALEEPDRVEKHASDVPPLPAEGLRAAKRASSSGSS